MKNFIVRACAFRSFRETLGLPRGMSLAINLGALIFLAAVSGRATAQTVTTLYTFSGGYDGGAVGGAFALSGSVLYGTTEGGGAYGQGDVFSMPVTGGSVAVLSSLSGARAVTRSVPVV